MAEQQKEKRNENIKKVNDVFVGGGFNSLSSDIANYLKSAKSIKAKLEEKLAFFAEQRAKAESDKVSAETESVKAEKVESSDLQESKALSSAKVSEKADETKKAEPKQEKVDAKTQTEAIPVTPSKPMEEVKAEAPKARPSFIVRHEASAPARPRPQATGNVYQPTYDNRRNNRQGNQNGDSRNFSDKKSFGNKSQFGDKSSFNRKPRETYIAPAVIEKTDKRSFNKKKQNDDSLYEDKHTINKRALIKNQVSIDDFDEDKTGYRKFRPVKKAKEQVVNTVKIEKAVMTTEIIALKTLSEKIGVTAAEITKRLFKEGIMKTINDSVDFDTAAYIADEFGITLELKLDKTAEDVLSEGFVEDADDPATLVRRPPVVTVMGHVDHGKTSLLDRIRKTNVTAGEAGGITQHIGAYQVSVNGKQITFLDTPGHAAFTSMRARGAQATDIAVLVVAADDGIMPQTIEAINHAKAANVPIIVAINKIDKPEANAERIKTQLTEHGLLPEEWGGDVMVCPISAKAGIGIDKLLESIDLLAEIKDLKANPNRKAKGVVIEAKLDQSKGPIATVLVQNGTLKVSDPVIVGTVTGKIRAMVDDKGRRVNSAGPSTPVSIMGLDDVPNAGDIMFAVEQEKLLKEVAEERKNKERENMIKSSQKVSLDDVFNKISEGEIKGLNIIVKADVQGSVEAVKQSMEKLSNDEVKVNVIHSAVGAINDSDVMLAESSHAVIIGFNVRPDTNAKQSAERTGVDIKLYRVIYEALEDVEKALKGMLAPKITEVYLGKAEVREVFKISGVGQVAGCYVTEGKIIRSGKLRIYRNDIMICEGNVLQLKRFKDDVKEVAQGFECGISIEKFNDIKVGDFIECYQVEESKQ